MVERNTEHQEQKKHTLHLEARRRLLLEGVTDVESFDEHAVELVTDCGRLTVEGEGLHIGTLDVARGTLAVQGEIGGIYYSSATPQKRGLRARLLH